MILVVGATGTVGKRVIDHLLSNPNNKVRAIARGKSDWEGSVLPSFRRRGVDVMVGDIRSEASIERAVKDVKCIINCAGLMRATPEEDLAEVNIEGTRNLIDQGKQAGVQRFIQLSCLGATEHAVSQYFGCKWEADELVQKSGMYWTIFRPSLIFDPGGSNLSRILEFWILRSPLIVMVGSGLNRFQPISAADVAACIFQSVYDRDTVNKIYELSGPETLDLNSLLSLVAEEQGRTFRAIKIPSFLGVPLFGLLGRLNPKCPIDNNIMGVMTSDMISDDEKPMLSRFQINRTDIRSSLKELPKKAASIPMATANDMEDEEAADAQDEAEAKAEAEAQVPVEEEKKPEKPKLKKPPTNFKRKI